MKQIYLLLIFLSALVFGCQNNNNDVVDPTGPQLSFKTGDGYTASDVNVHYGDTIKIGLIATAGSSGLSHWKVSQNAQVSDSTVISGSELDQDFSFIAPSQTGAVVLEFEVQDNNNLSVKKEILVGVTEPADNIASGIVNTWKVDSIFQKAIDGYIMEPQVLYESFRVTFSVSELKLPATYSIVGTAPVSPFIGKEGSWTLDDLASPKKFISTFDASQVESQILELSTSRIVLEWQVAESEIKTQPVYKMVFSPVVE